MSSSNADTDNSSSRSGTSFITNIVIALIGASATIGGGLLTYKLQEQNALCTDFNSRYDKIADTNDSGKKLKRLKALIVEKSASKCGAYASAMHELKELGSQIKDSVTGNSQEPKVLTGHSVGDSDTIIANQFVPDEKKIDDPSKQIKTASLIPAPPEQNAAITGRSVAQEVASSSPSPAIEFAPPQQDTSPVLTVTPESASFEGRVGDRLVLRRDVSYALRPPQYFIALTHGKSATLTVVGTENGAHLGISDCDPAAG